MKITLSHITKQFAQTTAVSDFTAEIESGHLIALLGPSGCGKSTMLNMISGILPVTSGQILFDDNDVTDLSANRRGVGLVFQNYALYPHMTVMQNICFPLELQKVAKAERMERAMAMAKLVHVEELIDRKPSQLSGGQQQRVAIARALVKNPNVLLLDEPLSNLDARLRIEMREEIRRIQQETKITTIFVTHDQEEAMSISDKIVLMKLGVLQQMDVPQNLYDSPANCFVADFLGNPPINKTTGVVKDGGIQLDNGPLVHDDRFTNLKDGQRVILSIRAEAATVTNENGNVDCVVDTTYIMGKESLAYVKLGDQRIRIYIPAEHAFGEGSTLHLKLGKRGVFVFDETSGDRLV